MTKNDLLMTKNDLVPIPTARSLRIFAFDPSLSAHFDTAGIGEITIRVPWEKKLGKGPVGEYIEVVDVDPASGVAYCPVDLNDERVLSQHGLAPSETNPQFHQQMVYAVAMATIVQFELALGRVALWSSYRGSHATEPDNVGDDVDQFVRRLRIYPHALRDRNAYYSPTKKALLFGYFPVGVKDANNTPGTLVFTCLSHDIIAHETAHALLDGVHPRFNEPINGDVFAFHEAFADIVALFLHFSYPGVLRDQIARTRGDLSGDNILGQLAQQFGKASGRGRALRDFLGKENAEGKWERVNPDVHELEGTTEPHARGAVLVAAVFNAFLKVYRSRTADLYRIASEGTGVLREGEIHPDLAARLADEAGRAAQQTLQMCIRAIDYCPPVGITFGNYLRAIITADVDFNPDDPSGYRLAFIESFRQWGIHPGNMRSMSAESLLWPTGESLQVEHKVQLDREDIKDLLTQPQTAVPPTLNTSTKPRRGGQPKFRSWNLETDRFEAWVGADENAQALWSWLVMGKGQRWATVIGIELESVNLPRTVFMSPTSPGKVAIEVHSVRTAVRRSQRGAPVTDLVVEITQRRRGYFDRQKQGENDAPERASDKPLDPHDFIYRAGCTFLLDANTMDIRRVIRTPGTITDNVQLERMRSYLATGDSAAVNAFYTRSEGLKRNVLRSDEPFALLHADAGG